MKEPILAVAASCGVAAAAPAAPVESPIETYGDSSLPLAPAVVQSISDFLTRKD